MSNPYAPPGDSSSSGDPSAQSGPIPTPPNNSGAYDAAQAIAKPSHTPTYAPPTGMPQQPVNAMPQPNGMPQPGTVPQPHMGQPANGSYMGAHNGQAPAGYPTPIATALPQPRRSSTLPIVVAIIAVIVVIGLVGTVLFLSNRSRSTSSTSTTSSSSSSQAGNSSSSSTSVSDMSVDLTASNIHMQITNIGEGPLDEDGKRTLLVTYVYTNNGTGGKWSPLQAYPDFEQNGQRLSIAVFNSADRPNGYTISSQISDLAAGETRTVVEAYVLPNTTDPITITPSDPGQYSKTYPSWTFTF